MKRTTICIGMAFAAVTAPRLGAQSNPSYPFAIAVHSASVTDGVAEISYRLTSIPGSTRLVYLFSMPLATSLIRITSPDSNWATLSGAGPDGWVEWQVLDSTVMVPGDTSPDLTLSAVGTIGVVQASLYPYWPIPDEGAVDAAESSGTSLTPPPMIVMTLGVIAAPDPSQAINRLVGAAGEACTLSWIDNHGICNSLSQKLAAAAASLDRNDSTSARNQLGAFINELNAQRGKHVSDNAYWLLKTNADYVLMHL